MSKNGQERVKELYKEDRHYFYHVNQFENPYRSTVYFAKFVKQIIGDCNKKFKIIDVGCGGGAYKLFVKNVSK